MSWGLLVEFFGNALLVISNFLVLFQLICTGYL